MTNWKRVNAVVSHLRAHPEEHDQGTFGLKTACGTTACMAGRTCLLYAPEKVFWWQSAFGVRAGSADLHTRGDRPEDGDPSVLARELLGLTEADAAALFFVCGSLGGIELHLARMREHEDAQRQAAL